jgi:predicted O-methyltransferase YrrM
MQRLAHKLVALAREPHNAPVRVRNKLEAWLDRFAQPCNLSSMDDAADVSEVVRRFLSLTAPLEIPARIDEVEKHIERVAQSPGQVFFEATHKGTRTLGRVCYLLCRFLQPRSVVETGVAHGITSAYMLQALAENEHGKLHSIDLPPLAAGAASHVGLFVPRELRAGWNLRVGSAKHLLPHVIKQVRTIDLFVHDSLHTYSHMKWEFETALAALRPGGVLIADDIEGNRAFEEVVRRPDIDSWFVIRQEGKSAWCGALRTKEPSHVIHS